MTDNLMPIDEARQIRSEKAAAMSLLETGELRLAVILRKPPRVLSGATLWDLMVACKGFGPAGAKHTLQAAGVWPMTELKDTTKAQRTRILENLPPRMKD